MLSVIEVGVLGDEIPSTCLFIALLHSWNVVATNGQVDVLQRSQNGLVCVLSAACVLLADITPMPRRARLYSAPCRKTGMRKYGSTTSTMTAVYIIRMMSTYSLSLPSPSEGVAKANQDSCVSCMDSYVLHA